MEAATSMSTNGKLPPRMADTMSDAIAMSSPNGRMSKRARKVAEKKLSTSLFGEDGLKPFDLDGFSSNENNIEYITIGDDIETIRRRVCLKHALRRGDIEFPCSINEDERELSKLCSRHSLTPIPWQEIIARRQLGNELDRHSGTYIEVDTLHYRVEPTYSK